MTDILEAKKFGGFVTVELIRDGADGPKVIRRETVHNTVVDQGKRQTWRQAANLNTNAWDNFRIGTCGNAVTPGETDLVTPITGTQTAATLITLLAATRTFQLVVSYASGGGSKSATDIQEVIVCNKITSASTVSILMRATFTAVNKTTADKLKITYNVRIT
jgi:hypothetical protein